jgi:hypothetical protein
MLLTASFGALRGTACIKSKAALASLLLPPHEHFGILSLLWTSSTASKVHKPRGSEVSISHIGLCVWCLENN